MKSNTPILQHLFEIYKSKPESIVEINKICEKYDEDAIEVSGELNRTFSIRERIILPRNVVACRISLGGINEVDHLYIEQKVMDVLEGLNESGGRGNINACMDLPIELYSIGLDIKSELELRGLAKFEMASFPYNTIVMELTKEGRKMLDGSPTFINI